ncbi:MAG: hypothetical protein QMC59_04200 [Candidatus Poseidoniaceae archaeon]
MDGKKTLRKLKKLTSRLTNRMEEMRDLMDDMEIEFEMMQKQISILETKDSPDTKSATKEPPVLKDLNLEEGEEDEDEDLDLENTTTVFVKPKF